MKSLFAIGASALVMGLASVGGAQAQATVPGANGTAILPSVSDVVGGAITGLQNNFGNGNWLNEAYNIGDIDGSVTLGQVGAEAINRVDLGRVQANVQASGAGAVVVLPPAAGTAGAVQAALDVDLGAIETIVRNTGGISSTLPIKTTVLGAVNTGDIAAIGTSAAATANSSTSTTAFTVSGSVNSASESAANTSNTAASAAASSDITLALQGPTSTITNTLSTLQSGPLTDVYAANRAYNAADINGRVVAAGNSIGLAGVETTVLGAVNTGTISQGFNGSAFVAQTVTGQ